MACWRIGFWHGIAFIADLPECGSAPRSSRTYRMIGAIARKLFGSSNERRIKGYLPRVAEINALEKELEALSDEALRARTDAFKQQVAAGTSLDDLLVAAFSPRRGAAKTTLRERHFDGHVISGTIPHD